MSLELKSQAPLTKADPVWYLISEAWIRSWREYVRGRKRRRDLDPSTTASSSTAMGAPSTGCPLCATTAGSSATSGKNFTRCTEGPAIVRRRIDTGPFRGTRHVPDEEFCGGGTTITFPSFVGGLWYSLHFRNVFLFGTHVTTKAELRVPPHLMTGF